MFKLKRTGLALALILGLTGLWVTRAQADNAPAAAAAPAAPAAAVPDPTGANTGGTSSSQSYYCGGTTLGFDTCEVGGIGYIADQNGGTISYAGYKFNQTLFPWFNNQNNYHVMFWENAGGVPMAFLTKVSDIGAVISYYVPPTSTTSPTTDTGGFFGWVGRGLGGAWNAFSGAAGSIINTVAGPVMNFGNSFLSVMISGFTQSLTIFLLGFRVILNAVGNFLHIGNIGDAFISFMTFLGTLVTDTLTVIYNFFTAVISLMTTGYIAFIVGIVSLLPTLLAIALFLWSLVFGVNFTVDDIAFVMFAYLTFQTAEHGLKGFFSTLMLYVFIVTFPFDAAWRVYDIATRGIHRTKETADPVG